MISTIRRNPEISPATVIFAAATLAIRTHSAAAHVASQIAQTLYTAFSIVISIVGAIWRDVAFCAVCIGFIAACVAVPMLPVGLACVAVFAVVMKPRKGRK